MNGGLIYGASVDGPLAGWRTVGLVLGLAGLIDSLYLSAESLSSQVPLYCPSGGIVNCVTVTSSEYSRFAGVPVAVLGASWFAVMLLLFALNRPAMNYALVPLWAIGMVFVGYLVFAELVLVHAICPYCTVAHALAVLMVWPAFKLGLEGE